MIVEKNNLDAEVLNDQVKIHQHDIYCLRAVFTATHLIIQ